MTGWLILKFSVSLFENLTLKTLLAYSGQFEVLFTQHVE